MKKISRILLLTAVISITVVSCDLDRFPYNSIEQSQSFKTMKDAATHRNGLYASFRSRIYGIYMYSTDVQADILNATLDYGNRNGFPHRWTEFLAGDYTIRDTWRGYYSALADVNNLIENLGTISTADAAEAATLDNYIGEAYFLRAFYYHMLVKRWAKDYEPATAATDPGVPLVTSFDVTLRPSRSTVEQVYQQIVADLTEAEAKITTAGAASSKSITADCVTALQARVYLDMHNWSADITAANSLKAAYPLITDAAAYKNMWGSDVPGSEVILQLHAAQPSELGPANVIYLGYNSGLTAPYQYVPDFVPTQPVVDLYLDADIRKGAYIEQKDIRIQGGTYDDIWLINKYPGNPALFTAATTNYQHKPIVFRVAEMYLISAEAGAQTPATEAAALATLNELRVARGLTALVGLTG
ncbi:MAG: RagB/SusD family nutrient uptake outer membrane protein, partial [Bacteroidales bacterium]|nr:RagB/SusD family nutrient uptake outer membrane protein [Bacteroidales bacterium]